MRIILLAACALSACTFGPADQNQVNETVLPDNAVAETPDNLLPPQPIPANAADNTATPVAEAPAVDETAQGAADVVQTYYALIGERKYAEAWALCREFRQICRL
jgi:cell division septation protein DedD